MKSTAPITANQKKTKILITGATGATGGHAIIDLLRRNIPVRALVHKIDERSEKLRAQGVEIALGDISDFESVTEALKGITGAYFVFPITVPGIVEATAFFAQTAIEQGVGAIVNMSQISARRVAKSHAARNHWIAERLLDRSGIPVTHLRPTFFAEWLMYQSKAIREQNILPLPFGEARYAPIAAEDQGRVIGAILSNPAGHAGKVYPLYGSKELTQFEIAEILSSILGRNISYVAMEIEAFKPVLKEMGFTPYFIQHISAVAQDCRDGVFSGTNDLVEKLTGQTPLSMADYIVKNQALFN
ncbi:MAG TPA: NmrA family NAD(P)-binding protein [Verrucomicrobiae bacterium]|nr:NmrA family NAD(P)-binding protein [Verrucomicrobiae bacterium]